jgi:hypothetical protein
VAGAAIGSRFAHFELPGAFEPNVGQAANRAQFLTRGRGATVLLTASGMEIVAAGNKTNDPKQRSGNVSLRFESAGQGRQGETLPLEWQGAGKVAGETNYFIGNDPRRWRMHVPHFARAVARQVVRGVDAIAYGGDGVVEYDLRVAPGVDPATLRVAIRGAGPVRVDSTGDLLIGAGEGTLRMRKPVMYEDPADATSSLRKAEVEGGYVLEADGTVGFRVGAYDKTKTLIIDPSLSVGYATFLGGEGADSATTVTLDAEGKIYLGGTTTSLSTFSEPATARQGPTGGAADFFIAKIDPTKSGPASLVFLTFIGGSATEAGGEIALDPSGNIALAGTTTSIDYPVTDGSTLTQGAGGLVVNDLAVTEIDPTGAKLLYSTLFGGNGNQATLSSGGVATDSSGDIVVAMDTQSTNLTTAPTAAPGPFQMVYGGGASDGFLAIFQPATVVTGTTSHLKYCTYLGIDAQATVTGVAVDSVGNAYLAGYTSDPQGTLVTTNGFQTTYGGDPYDGFVMKILPSGNGANDLSYGTFLGGSGSDQIQAIALGTPQLPGTVYVTGSTQSSNFPVNGTIAGFQGALRGTQNAFVSVISQFSDGTTGLSYSTYLGGTEPDAGLGIFFAATNQVYVSGSARSWDFPWQYNFQPFSGDEDAFVAELDPTSAAAASLLYATPLGGTAPAGVTATAQGNSIAADGSGNFYVAGTTTAADFPRAGSSPNALQVTCASCQENPPLGDAFVVQGIPSAEPAPAVSFNAAKLNFGTQPVGAATVPQAVAVINTGDSALSISQITITGANEGDFSLIGPAACMTGPIPAGMKCSFEVGFVASIVGPEEAFLSFTDNGPANPQTLTLAGVGGGPYVMVSPGAVNFGSQPIGTKSAVQVITVTNSGTDPVAFTEVAIGGANESQFIQSDVSDACVSGNLQPGLYCLVAISFQPTTTGTLTAEVDRDNAERFDYRHRYGCGADLDGGAAVARFRDATRRRDQPDANRFVHEWRQRRFEFLELYDNREQRQ